MCNQFKINVTPGLRHSRLELAKFQRRVNEGRAVVGKYSADIKLPSFAKTYAGSIDSADKKLRQALASISNAEAPAVPATRD